MKIIKKTQQKIDLVKKWVKENGRIWSRKVLYICVTAGLVRDTSKNSWNMISKLFTRLRRENPEEVPYTLFQDKKTVETNTGIESFVRSFDDYFKLAVSSYERARDSKSLQKAYVELFTEKDLPEPIEQLLRDYEIGLVSSGGFGGDVALYYALERLKRINKKFDLPIIFYCLGDYDAEGEYIVSKIKERYEIYGIKIEKLAITKQQVIDLQLTPNKEYREKMRKPKTMKFHLQKKYVQNFFNSNKNIAPDGICQFEPEALETPFLLDLIESAVSSYISIEKIERSREIFRKEAQEWTKKHYKE